MKCKIELEYDISEIQNILYKNKNMARFLLILSKSFDNKNLKRKGNLTKASHTQLTL